MLDNPVLVKELMHELKSRLPIPVIPTKALQKTIKDRGFLFPKGYDFVIEELHYMGDEGGICCGISVPANFKEDLVVSITHLCINKSDLLGKKVLRYQKKRVKKLAHFSCYGF
jgi:hypothetical protein